MVARTPMAADDFEAVAGELGRCELVRGKVVRMSPAGFDHGRICGEVAGLLRNWVRANGCGCVLVGGTGIVVERGPDTVRGADVAYVSYRRIPKGTRSSSFLDIAPELVIEVLGGQKTWRVAVQRTGEYLRIGVDRVWLIEPARRRMHVFRADQAPLILEEDELVSDPELLPGFSCRLADFFAD